MMIELEHEAYASAYEETGLWRKLGLAAGRLGRMVVGVVLTLYFCMLDPDTPVRVKLAIAAGLGYLISPLDAVPDLLPMIGLADDGAVLTGILAAVTIYVKPRHRALAEERLSIWFG